MAKECIVCKTINHSAANHCTNCGNELPDKELTVEDQLRVELHRARKSKEILEKALADAQKEKKPEKQDPAVIKKTIVIRKPEPVFALPKVAENEKKPFPYTVLYVGLALLLIVGGSVIYFAFYKPYVKDRDSPRYYTFSGSITHLRSSQEAGVQYNIVSRLPYGSELILYDYGYEWSKVKWKDPQTQKALKGYISSTFVLPYDDFIILNNIWGDQDSKEIINEARCRKALLNYVKSAGTNVWKVFSKTKGSKPNTIYYGKIKNPTSKYQDFAVIIKNESSGDRRLLLFSFDDEYETPSLVFSEDVLSAGDIVSITYNNKTDSFTVTYSK